MALSDATCTALRERTKASGFTLIEVMIVVAIVAILAAVALPSYDRYVKKARRTDAKQALLDFAARQEKYFSTHNLYAGVATDIGYTTVSSASPIPVSSGATSYYDLTFTTSAAPPGFTATATPTGAQVADDCHVYTLDHLGAQGNSGVTDPSLECW